MTDSTTAAAEFADGENDEFAEGAPDAEPTEPTEDVYIEHVDRDYNHEFLDSHVVTAKQANDAWGEDYGVKFTKDMRWGKANKWRIPAADLDQAQIDALLSDPQFREKRVPRTN